MLKVLYSLVIFTFCTVNLPAQPGQQLNCQNPISALQFQRLNNNLSMQGDFRSRLVYASNLVSNNCITTLQLMTVLSYFGEDIDKLSVAMNGYPQVVNKQDIYDVFDSFAYFSTAFKFNDYINNFNGNQPVVVAPAPVPVQITYPQLNYPNPAAYRGQHNCNLPVTEQEFNLSARQIAQQGSQNLKYKSALDFASTYCITVAQVMKLTTLLSSETDRINILKVAYPNMFDEGNSEQAAQVFGIVQNRNEFLNFINLQRQQNIIPEAAPCNLDENKFQQMKSIFAREISSSTRVSIVKDQLPLYNCYKSSQIKEIVATFISSSDKMTISKFAYDYVIDRENYFFEISPLLNSSMDRKALSNYIASRP